MKKVISILLITVLTLSGVSVAYANTKEDLKNPTVNVLYENGTEISVTKDLTVYDTYDNTLNNRTIKTISNDGTTTLYDENLKTGNVKLMNIWKTLAIHHPMLSLMITKLIKVITDIQ